MSKLEELKAKREAAAAEREVKRQAQIEKDLEAILALEESRGESLHVMYAPVCKPGVQVCAAFRPATRSEYKRYIDTIARAPDRNRPEATRKAQDLLAQACLVYPPEADREAYFDAFPGALPAIVIEVHKLAELDAEESSKK